MSHQTGIKCGDELKDIFRVCTTSGTIRCVKISIVDETLVPSACVDKTSDSWESEFDDAVYPLYEDKQPCYVLYQLESHNEWLVITYSPDDSPTREKMLYAATRSTLKSEFGGGFIQEELFGNSKDEVSLEGYKEHLAHKAAPPPLTNAEEELKLMDETDTKTGIGSSTRHQTVQGISFPITKDVESALQDYKEEIITHVEMSVDTEKEIIYKTASHSIMASDLDELISSTRAGYHLFRYAHRYNNEDVVTNIFIYSMPGYSIPIKARMLYSSCKAPLLDVIEQDFKIPVDKKLEIDSKEKVNEEYLRNEVHPPTADTRQTFSKPKAPGRRAPTRRPRNGV